MQKKKETVSNDSLEEAKRRTDHLRLYLVAENGPLSFVYKDESSNKFKVTIGETPKCSCVSLPLLESGLPPFCIHIFYTFFKVFRISTGDKAFFESPVLTSNNLDELLRRRFRPATPEGPQRQIKRSKNFKISSTSTANRRKVNLDSLCPICQESFGEPESICFCDSGCGNPFHIKCLLVWVEHKISTKDKVTCPMCRGQWPLQILTTLERSYKAFVHKRIMHLGFQCASCKIRPIKGSIYACLFCENSYFCKKCIFAFSHVQHSFFFTKEFVDSKWSFVQIRPANGLLEEEEASENMNDILWNLDFDYMPGGDRGLSIIGKELSSKYCDACKLPVTTNNFKKLPCGHFIDKKCFQNACLSESYSCPLDGKLFHPGLRVIAKRRKKETQPGIETQKKLEEKSSEKIKKPTEIIGPSQEKDKKPQKGELIGNRRSGSNSGTRKDGTRLVPINGLEGFGGLTIEPVNMVSRKKQGVLPPPKPPKTVVHKNSKNEPFPISFEISGLKIS